ncbi:MAG: thiamine ABC transporter substrate-binding protein [Corynebacteriales bacterium]|nr:thiamine ABC transporter substrate-binding protein [Mycobacteriales bacterium]
MRVLSARLGVVAAVILAATATLTACSSTDDKDIVTLVTHESFAISDDAKKAFEDSSGITLKILRSGDAGTAINQAILTKGNPQGDVFYGLDNTHASRALEENVFTPYEAKDLKGVNSQFHIDDSHQLTPIDFGDVCVNFDREYYQSNGQNPPQSFADLAKPEYKNQLVVQNPATSSPGLAFMLGSVAEFGEDEWAQYWQQLKDNEVEVVDGWEHAYYERFSGGANNGDKPLVVSYASSPPAEVGEGENPDQAPTGVVPGTCFRQVEYAGLLDGAKNADNGRKLIDFLISQKFQEDLPENMYVYPVRDDVALPPAFEKYATPVDNPKTLAPSTIADNREQWMKTWKSTVLG